MLLRLDIRTNLLLSEISEPLRNIHCYVHRIGCSERRLFVRALGPGELFVGQSVDAMFIRTLEIFENGNNSSKGPLLRPNLTWAAAHFVARRLPYEMTISINRN